MRYLAHESERATESYRIPRSVSEASYTYVPRSLSLTPRSLSLIPHNDSFMNESYTSLKRERESEGGIRERERERERKVSYT